MASTGFASIAAGRGLVVRAVQFPACREQQRRERPLCHVVPPVLRPPSAAPPPQTGAARHAARHREAHRRGVATRADAADGEYQGYVGPRYDAEENAAYWSTRPATVANRLVEIGRVFGKWWVSTWLETRRDMSSVPDDELPPIDKQSAAQLREVLTRLGPAFVKIGQAVASRPDLLPPSYLRELEKLHDEIPSFPTEDALEVMKVEYGKPATEIFESLSTEALTAASLGQVYKGTLKKSGETVAVKVQRPGVYESISLDLFILRRLSNMLGRYFKTNTNLPQLLDEWGESLYKELDYTNEARNGRRFRRLFGHIPEVYVPIMYEAYTTQRVLVMEWVDGTKLRSASDGSVNMLSAEANADNLRLVEVGVRCSLEQMLEEGFYHADVHPGNLLRMKDGRLAYLDFGMMGDIGLPIRRGLIRATLHLVNREYTQLADDFVMLGLLPPDSNRDEIVPALTGVFQEALQNGVANLSFGSLSAKLGRTMYQYKFRIPSYYTLLVRSLSMLEGIALSTDPNYKVLGSAYPWIARRLLTDRDPVLRETLQALLYSDGKFQFQRLESLLEQAARSPARDSFIASNPPPPGMKPTVISAPTAFPRDEDARPHGQASAPFPACNSMTTSAAGESASVSGPLTNGAIALILSEDGDFIRNIILEEISRGLDSAIRIQLDESMRLAKSTVLTVLGVAGREKDVLSDVFREYPGSSVVKAIVALPNASEYSDREQIEGLTRLSNQLQKLAGHETSGIQDSNSARRLSIAEAAALLRWLSVEIGQLPGPQRTEALKIPSALAQKVSSRLTARTIRATLGANSQLAESVGQFADVKSLREWASRVSVEEVNV